MSTISKSTGIALALAAASLAGCQSNSDDDGLYLKDSSVADHVKCYGINSCQGQNDCKTASNACKGQGSCNGLGFVKSTKDLCEESGGQLKPKS